ncbi:stage III sporulation protein AF [Oscillospiraceae bacterium OttesenSCG-928-G22]|nr:stage III sporulation protein AF [Oscillospiraceae bacterium OttesenSCG-928-G22]
MTSFLTGWIVGVTAATLLVAVVLALTPDGQVRKVVRFVGGFVILIALLRPITSIDFSSFSYHNIQSLAEFQNYEETMLSAQTNGVKLIIEDKTGTYILQKAEEIGLDVRVQVQSHTPDEGYPYPVGVTITLDAPPDPEKREELTRLIERDIAVPAENQTWTVRESTS